MGKLDRSDLLALLVGCVLALAIVFGAGVVRGQQNACTQVNKLRGALVTVLQNGEKGLPQSPYFKQHPDQLAQAQAQYQAALVRLGPVQC